jgi:hypothetical protein
VSLARVQFFSISLDGFGTGEGRSLEAPFGHAGERLHEWMFVTRWWRQMVDEPGGSSGWRSLVVMADPARSGAGCPTGPGPADAKELAQSIRSDPGLEATAPVSVGTRGAAGLAMDVAIAAGVIGDPGCRGISGRTVGMPWLGGSVSVSSGERMRLYLFDAPEGLSMRTLAIAVVVPESQFDRAAPALDSVEFHAP